MQTRFLDSISRVPAAQWNTLDTTKSPFLRHEFFTALESTGCVGEATGWIPHHLLIEDDAGNLLGAVPLFLKTHSWGEFVFDWSWARAYTQAGLEYYPKLVSMPPFTPATGPRLLVARDTDEVAMRRTLARTLVNQAQARSMSSAHAVFVTETDRDALRECGFLLRQDCQFHWHNRGFTCFDDFIATFRSEKRKKALRERRKVVEGGVTYRTLSGAEIADDLWDLIFAFSARTFEMHGHEHYLNAAFFKTLCATLPGAVMVKLAMLQRTPIAAAIFFRSSDTLYGRYWGAAANFDSLHFETCYFQGIDYCIEHGLQHFEPGTQGEHKVARGFEPTMTWSAHWIADPRFRHAIDNYLAEERAAVDNYAATVREHVPFHRAPG